MGQRASIKFCFKTGKTTTKTFLLKKQAYGENSVSLINGFVKSVQGFGTGVIISKMTNAVDDQQPFEQLT
jgi:hypothetical protein